MITDTSLRQHGLSVIICCYNSVQKLPPTLSALSQQQLTDAVPCELVLVDNACTDGTVALAQTLWQQLGAPFPLRIVEEPRPGQAFARIKGLQVAAYALAIFCDDDNWLASDYLSIAERIMSGNSEIGILGGYSTPVSDQELPHWFTTNQAFYAVGVPALFPGNITGEGLIWGAGMVLRTAVYHHLVELGFHTIMQGRSGGLLSCGDDSELCYWYIAAGYQLWYSEELHLQHYMTANRLTKDYFLQLKAASYTSYQRVFAWEAVLLAQKSRYLWQRLFYFGLFSSAALFTRKPRFMTLAEAYNPFSFVIFRPEVHTVRAMLNKRLLPAKVPVLFS